MPTDGKGQAPDSELNLQERELVSAYQPTPEDMSNAQALLNKLSAELDIEKPDQATIEQAARIIGSLGDSRIPRDHASGPHALWLMTEAYLAQERNSSILFEKAMASLVRPSRAETSDNSVMEQIRQLELAKTLSIPERPQDENNPVEMRAYRTALAMRHLRESLDSRNGIYRAANMESLNEILLKMIDVKGFEELRPLYDKVASTLSGKGVSVDGWLAGITQEQFGEIARVIAESDLAIHERTSEERYMNQNGKADYVATDTTMENMIYDLHKKLSPQDQFTLAVEQAQKKELPQGPLAAYIRAAHETGAGYCLSGDAEYATLNLANGNMAEMCSKPYGRELQPGEILISLRLGSGITKRQIVVRTPQEAVAELKKWGESSSGA